MGELLQSTESREFGFRFAVCFLGSFLLAALAGLLLAFTSARSSVSDREQHESIMLGHVHALMSHELGRLPSPLQQLAASQPVSDFLQEPSQSHREEVIRLFLLLLRYAPEYQQARVLEANGRELVRLEVGSVGPVVVEQAALQDKSDQNYFREGMALGRGQFYLSALDRKVEGGQIERPFRPTLRLVIPIFRDEPRPQGALVFNYSAEHLIKRFQGVLSGSAGGAMILNNDGYWLFSENERLRWGVLRDQGPNFGKLFPEVWAQLRAPSRADGIVKAGGETFVYRALDPLLAVSGTEPSAAVGGARWFLVSQVPTDEWLTAEFMASLKSGSAKVMLLLALAVSLLIARVRTSQLQALVALQRGDTNATALLDNAPDGIIQLDAALTCKDVNKAACLIFGRERSELLATPMEDLLAQCQGRLRDDLEAVDEDDGIQVTEIVIERGDGTTLPVEVSSHYLKDGGWQGFFRDISERKATERGLLRAEAVFLNTAEGIIITDGDGKILDVNPAFSKISGFAREEVIGKNPRIQQSGHHDQAFYRKLWRALDAEGSWTGEIWNRRKSGEVYAAWENIATVENAHGQVENYISIISDISTLKDAESRLAQLANEDSLTGLLNRRAFGVALGKAIDRAKRHDYGLALLYLDLDRFKLVNDTLGHAVGDRLLKRVAEAILGCVRSEDVVARLGGDEFTVLIEHIATGEDAAIIAHNLIQALDQPMVLEGQEFITTASLGIAMFPRDGRGASELSRAADAAMYRAKSQGRNTYQFYNEDMTHQATERFETEAALRQALLNDEFELHYQPQWALDGLSVVGVEALVRWRHPERGLLEPDQFIAVAEESNLINDIGSWVLRAACRQYGLWLNQGLTPLKVAINLSGRQLLYGNVPATFRDCLKSLGLEMPAGAIEFEVTETMLQSGERAVSALLELQRMGAVVAIDDFGCGYSSLGQLTRLPVDTLKIDQGFVRGVPDDGVNSAIVRAVISMAHSMGLEVVAEGVEDERQLQFLQGLGCNYGQGYLFSKPVFPAEIYDLVQASRTEVPLK
ncbi:bifunctional diguanylate cyclase/phosphodiesterase [Marinobacter sp. SS21]|uniref:bifunctional diguanylate cyclase/phosphodiesterase n=1 Tax=Marinobacter sp. SS21 TaxID=2979460 RepID=UPI00232F831C|nr:EAL domain-containing protein [Marinobacter sp. SS21]MDC0663501.1 EAL domain-containing protein [Marinobacter sp. SS21]